jgi:tetratricopeptide (TPR) repeat protein
MLDTKSLGQGRSLNDYYLQRLNRLNRRIEWNPEGSWTHFQRAVCYFFLGEPNKARDDLEVYVKHQENKETKAQIYSWFASYMTFIPRPVSHHDVLVELARQAVVTEPNDPDHLRALALSNYRAGFYQETINTLNQAIDIGYKGEEIHMLMCMAYWQMNQKALARNWFNKSTFFEKIPTMKRNEKIISAGHENYIWMYTILRSQAQLLVSTSVPDQ